MSKLWVPGQRMELHDEYPVPATQELIEYWQDYMSGEIVEAPGVYGCIRLPDAPPMAYVSIDVCEVLRETHRGLRKVAEAGSGKYSGNIHRYGDGTPITSGEDITSVLQVLMTKSLIEPVDGIGEISSILQRWRNKGVYTVANTSTLPGCEKGTIGFFRTYLPHAIDGILLPRNHDGTLPLTKGHAFANVIASLTPTPSSAGIVAVHIDDSPHHNIAVREQMSVLGVGKVATFQPEYPSHLPADTASVITRTPLDAFRAADQFLSAALAHNSHVA